MVQIQSAGAKVHVVVATQSSTVGTCECKCGYPPRARFARTGGSGENRDVGGTPRGRRGLAGLCGGMDVFGWMGDTRKEIIVVCEQGDGVRAAAACPPRPPTGEVAEEQAGDRTEPPLPPPAPSLSEKDPLVRNARTGPTAAQVAARDVCTSAVACTEGVGLVRAARRGGNRSFKDAIALTGLVRGRCGRGARHTREEYDGLDHGWLTASGKRGEGEEVKTGRREGWEKRT